MQSRDGSTSPCDVRHSPAVHGVGLRTYPGAMNSSSSSGRGLTIAWVVLVVLLAMIAAAVTWVVSERTYGPSERTMSAKTQVAAGSEYTDEAAGLTFRVPEGWMAESGPMPFGTTAMMPEEMSAKGGLVFIGALTPEMLGGQDVNNEQAAIALANSIGQSVLPIPVRPVGERADEISTRVGDGTSVWVRVVGAGQQQMLGPDGALIYSAVVGEGDSRFWLTYIGSPADGSMVSPAADWAEAIVKKFELAEDFVPAGTA